MTLLFISRYLAVIQYNQHGIVNHCAIAHLRQLVKILFCAKAHNHGR